MVSWVSDLLDNLLQVGLSPDSPRAMLYVMLFLGVAGLALLRYKPR
jgi:hypothetical protein